MPIHLLLRKEVGSYKTVIENINEEETDVFNRESGIS